MKKRIPLRIPGINSAIPALRKNADWDLEVCNGKYTWHRWSDDENIGPPTAEEINERIAKDQVVYDYFKYERDRLEHYLNIGEQLDMMYHDIKSGRFNSGNWIEMIESIKSRFPKPEQEPPEELQYYK